ncbi:MAG: LptF/LptG family permease, partial [Litorimonas sp.]
MQRYLWSQAFWPTVLTLAALALLALLTQSLQTLDLIVENRQSALTFLKITTLALPQLIGIILPLAVFMAALYALNRMNGDSEIIVAKAAGASPWQIGSPLVRLGVMAMIAHLVITLALQSFSFREMRSEILK